MPEFHHPYNFIPVTGKINGRSTSKTDYGAVKQGETAARHDLWQTETFSGRIICRLHLDTPTVVGAEQIEEDGFKSKRVSPYRRNGQPAIPANSLRGMIGAIAETLSQSSLRVIEDRPYSVREPISQGRSAMGILLKSTGPDHEFDLLPLTIPALKTQGSAYELESKWKKVFEIKGGGTAPLTESLPVHVDGYASTRTKQGTRLSRLVGSFLDTMPERPSYSSDRPCFYRALLAAGVPTQPVGNKITVSNSALKERPYTDERGTTTYTLIGQRLTNCSNAILSEKEWTKLGKPGGYTQGILRVLGIEGRAEDMPPTKKHELFIPFPPSSPRKRIPVPDRVIEQFQALAKERQAEQKDLPYSLTGYTGWEPQAGQLFFFEVEPENGRPIVSRISISSIWRKSVNGSAWDFFRDIDPDLLPWNPKRTELTPAELMFGVVEDRKDNADEQDNDEMTEEDAAKEAEAERLSARTLASRLRFHDALPLQGATVAIHTVTLKILNSPKPPCPAMYFHPKNGTQGVFIHKTRLNKAQHLPNGRKVYLHHPWQPGEEPWVTADSTFNADQKLRCTPLDDKQDFYFHIDFDNLTKPELTLLLKSLRPSDNFRHRLGLGKSLGLGTVRVDIEGVWFIDRQKRYARNGLNEPRYDRAWRPVGATAADWDKLYPEEAERLKGPNTLTYLVLERAEFYASHLVDKRTLDLLNTVGTPGKHSPTVRVRPPLCDDQLSGAAEEQETFRWFFENEKRSGQQALQPIQADKKLPTLNTYPPKNKKSGS
ncbi:MAG: TIGR03986 family type III CRISPR-associated RAMP protein [Gammaproteobacteria bacterium]